LRDVHGFISPFWLTYRQAQELGGQVKKGEHGSPVVYQGGGELMEGLVVDSRSLVAQLVSAEAAKPTQWPFDDVLRLG
jgi:hypothetical protein